MKIVRTQRNNLFDSCRCTKVPASCSISCWIIVCVAFIISIVLVGCFSSSSIIDFGGVVIAVVVVGNVAAVVVVVTTFSIILRLILNSVSGNKWKLS